MSLNADSLCSARDMYDRKEILELYPIKNHSFDVHQMHQYQRLPTWMHGEFEFLSVDDHQIVYRDQSSFKTYTMKCMAYYNTDSIDDLKSVRLLTYSQTQCGKYPNPIYSCFVLSYQQTSKIYLNIIILFWNGKRKTDYRRRTISLCGDS